MLDHPAFNWVNTMIGHVKNSLRGRCHTLGARHLPRHLAEYCFRFNHRFDLKSMLVELIELGGSSRGKPSDAISALEAG